MDICDYCGDGGGVGRVFPAGGVVRSVGVAAGAGGAGRGMVEGGDARVRACGLGAFVGEFVYVLVVRVVRGVGFRGVGVRGVGIPGVVFRGYGDGGGAGCGEVPQVAVVCVGGGVGGGVGGIVHGDFPDAVGDYSGVRRGAGAGGGVRGGVSGVLPVYGAPGGGAHQPSGAFLRGGVRGGVPGSVGAEAGGAVFGAFLGVGTEVYCRCGSCVFWGWRFFLFFCFYRWDEEGVFA